MRNIIGLMFDVSQRDSGVSEIFGTPLSDEAVKRVCAAALPLKTDWLNAAQPATGDEDGIPAEQEKALKAWYQVAEDIWKAK